MALLASQTGRLMVVRIVGSALCVLLLWILACAPTEPAPDPSRRVWRGPNDGVASQGITTHNRRELAQKVPYPTCLTVEGTAYRFDAVEPQRGSDLVPPGYINTGYYLDRWRLLTRDGALRDQATLYVSVAGSTGILGAYQRQPAGTSC